MKDFFERIEKHSEHISNAGVHCSTEETTKQALILPLLDILGFSPFDPMKVKAEYSSDFPGAKVGERVDYALFCQAVPVMFIEAKAFAEKLTNHVPQLSRYFNATPEVAVAAITNGQEWRFFTDLNNKNVMDSEPFLVVNFKSLNDTQVNSLKRFCHDEFKPEALRTLAEESVFLQAFKDVIVKSVLDCDADFVKFVVGKSVLQRTLTAKFMETTTPIVKQAIALSMSEMVANSFSSKPIVIAAPIVVDTAASTDKYADMVDPSNPKIITTYLERRLFEVVQDVLGEESGVTAKDTESYYSILFQAKNNRWLMRYYADKKNPCIQVCVPLTDERKREIARAGLELSGETILLSSPEQISRITGIIKDAFDYCQNDANFKRVSEK
jgi:predicted type IV restriction endonuclease